MKPLNELKAAVEQGLRWIEKRRGVREAEVYASANNLAVLRICYATNVPSNGLEEPKSLDDFGLSARVVFKDGKVGFGKEDSALDQRAIKNVFLKAERNAVLDTDFKSLPAPAGKPAKNLFMDQAIAKLSDEKAIDKAYDCLGGAFDALARKKAERNLNITGELNFLHARMAIASTTGIKASDESTQALATLTTILEGTPDLAGVGCDSGTHLKDLQSAKTGQTSAEKALAMGKPLSIESGEYRAVLGRLAVTDLLHSRFEVGLNAIDEQASPFVGKLDQQLFSECLNIRDDALVPKAMGSKCVTDEGLPAGRTELVKDGRLVSFLGSDYYCKKFGDPRFRPRNGFRSGSGGRSYETDPGIHGTNFVVETGSLSDEELIKEVKNGIYIGRIWYTYPVNGLASSDFTTTIRGDSYVIENGEIKAALTPNTCRVSDNFERIFRSVLGLGKKKEVAFAWGQEPVIITPEIAVQGVKVERIAKGLY